jgi:hypothetical protein
MAIWCRKPLLFGIALGFDVALDVVHAMPARVLRPVWTLRAGTSGHAQSHPAMRRRIGR